MAPQGEGQAEEVADKGNRARSSSPVPQTQIIPVVQTHMRVIKDPVFVTLVLSGMAVGAGAYIAGDKYPAVSIGFLAAWVVVAGLAAYVLTKKYRHD